MSLRRGTEQKLSLLEDPLEKEMAAYSRILAWRIPWAEEPGGLQSMGSPESDTTERLKAITSISSLSSGSAAVVGGRGGPGGFLSMVLTADLTVISFQHPSKLSGSRPQPSPCVPSL